MKYLKTYEENKNNIKEEKNFDRIKYYLNYYKNLSPKGFKVKKENNDIIISIK